MSLLKILSLTICLFFIPSLINAQQYSYQFNDNCKNAYEHIINLKFEDGKKFIELEKNINPDNNIPYLLENYIYFFTLFIGENENEYDLIRENFKDDIFNRLEKGDIISPFHLYSLAQCHMQWGFIKLKFSDYISAAFDIRKSYLLFEENNEKFPEFDLNKLNLGIMHAAIGSVPESYSWIIKNLGIEGTIEQGVNEMNTILQSSYQDDFYSTFKPEILFYLSFMHINLTNDLNAAMNFVERTTYSPDSTLLKNPLIIYAFSRIYTESNKNEDALKILLNKPNGNEYFPFYYLDYLIGDLKLRQLESDANKYLLKFVMNFEGFTFIKTAYQKLAWYYYINDDDEKYYSYMQKVLTYGKAIGDPDKQAEREAKIGIPPNKNLLKARLLSDGGCFERANNLMEKQKKEILSKASLKDSTEYYYRRGRILDEWGKDQEAISHYRNAISLGSNLSNYFAANASLKLGIIFEKNGDFENALFYYEKAQSFPNKEYKSSINQKAKSGINRIQEKKE